MAARAVTPERPWIAPEAYGTRPVGHGHDLVGQVWEWASSASGEWRVLRGGSWASQRDVATAEARMVCPPSARFLAAGVRVARSL
jgi:formylglycine-generating enzyme required for sulfatase activity